MVIKWCPVQSPIRIREHLSIPQQVLQGGFASHSIATRNANSRACASAINHQPSTGASHAAYFFKRNTVPQYMQLNKPVHSRLTTAVAR